MTRDQRVLLIKLAAALSTAMKPADYNVVAGDNLSAIAKRNGTTWQDLAKLNGLADPNKLQPGQRLRIPVRRTEAPVQPPVKKPVAAPVQKPSPTAATPSAPSGVGFDAVSAELHKQFNNPNLEAAILANVNHETGGTFDYRTWKNFAKRDFDVNARQPYDYGLFQLVGPNLTGYKGWLKQNKRDDSMPNQVTYMRTVYGPSRAGWSKYTAQGAPYTKEQIADWWHRRVETPAHVIKGNKGYSVQKILQRTIGHNMFMKRLTPVEGVWGRQS